jgi:hypothetical protein
LGSSFLNRLGDAPIQIFKKKRLVYNKIQDIIPPPSLSLSLSLLDVCLNVEYVPNDLPKVALLVVTLFLL